MSILAKIQHYSGLRARYILTRSNRLRARYIAPVAVAALILPLTLSYPEAALPLQTDLTAPQSITSSNEDFDISALHFSEESKPEPVKEKPRTAYDKTLTIGSGDTIAGLLQKNGVNGSDAYDTVETLKEHFDPRKIRAGQKVTIHMKPLPESGYELASMDMKLDKLRDVTISKSEDGFKSTLHEKETETKTFAGTTSIQTSIYSSAAKAGIPQSIVAEMIRVYSWNVDFQRDIRQGDKIEVLYEAETTEDGDVIKYGNVLYANLSVNGKELPMYRFTKKDGSSDFFDPKGMSIKKTLMKTPIDGARLSSGFGMRRHPVLGYNKMHKGVDFAAASGTPIYAAGDGKITYAGRKGGYGNYIQIRHNGTLRTAYAHMKGFKKGIGTGSYVKQGEVIGYVGTTGRSTGPHLHYEVLKNGVQVNPRSVDLPTGEELTGTDLANFKKERSNFDRLYASLTDGVKYAEHVQDNSQVVR